MMPPYNSSIPQATDRINQSQGQLLGNFQEIPLLLGVNHLNFGDPNQGKHKFVTFPSQGGAPVTLGTDIDVYNAVTGGTQQLYVQRSAGTPIPFTQNYTNAARGWTYLPSGVLMVWGRENNFTLNPVQTYTFSTGLVGLPVFTNASPVMQFTRMHTGYASNNNQIMLDSTAGTTTTQFTVRRSVSSVSIISFMWVAIGV